MRLFSKKAIFLKSEISKPLPKWCKYFTISYNFSGSFNGYSANEVRADHFTNCVPHAEQSSLFLRPEPAIIVRTAAPHFGQLFVPTALTFALSTVGDLTIFCELAGAMGLICFVRIGIALVAALCMVFGLTPPPHPVHPIRHSSQILRLA
jgi:hypothetical protein